MKTLRDATNDATQALAAAGIIEPRMEAVSLLSHVINGDRALIIAHSDDELTSTQLRAFSEAVDRRANGEPLQYITGHQEFFKLDFEVTPDVLIPRPETELVVEAALDVTRGNPHPAILDIGTGSGCIIVSLLHEIPGARGVGVDISQKALGVARRNAARHQVLDRLLLMESDCLDAIDPASRFSLAVSNPPYIPSPEIESLQREVREHEPLAALVSGADGLSHIRRLLLDVPSRLEPGGHFIFEMGFGQYDAVDQLLDGEVWNRTEIRRDLQGIPRTVTLQKK